MLYWDTSALIKLYVFEPGSRSFRELVDETAPPILSSVITFAELTCTLFRKEATGDIDRVEGTSLRREFQEDCETGRIRLLPFDERASREIGSVIEGVFSGGPPVMLRALDAIHIASAISVRAAAVVTTDLRMRRAAVMSGMKVLPLAP